MPWPKLSALQKIPALLAAGRLDTAQQLSRIESTERNIGLPVRAGLMAAAAYYLFISRDFTAPESIPEVVHEFVRALMIVYLGLNIAASSFFYFLPRFGWGWIRWVVFTVSLMDGFFLAAVTLVAGGFDSALYWFFFGLLIRNAISVPVAGLQILLNFSVCVFYGVMTLVDQGVIRPEASETAAGEFPVEPFILRQALLLLMAACCYGIQVIYDRNARAQEDARLFQARQQQLHTAGRLAAEIAHQIKNPLAIINNAAFNLQRSPLSRDAAVAPQLAIIRDEVERSDQIITRIMDYAQLAEGQVERVNVAEVARAAAARIFPPGPATVELRSEIAADLPFLFIQRRHLEDMLVNLLQNAREAAGDTGHVRLVVGLTPAEAVEITVEDTGPGVPEELRIRVFEAYFTTKPKGSGLGLAVVKHNAELYGGTVRVDSALGKGARFVLTLPVNIATTP